MTDSDELQWPEEIWMAEREGHDQGVVTAVLSQHATVARFAGDTEREREFHRYVDGDMYDDAFRLYSVEMKARQAAERALREKDQAMQELFRRLQSAGVDYSDLIP